MRIGITGHRDYRDRSNIKRWMRGIAKRYPESTIVTGGALGTDLICAEEAVVAGLKSEIILPMPEEIFTGRWNDCDRERLMWAGMDSVVECLAPDVEKYEIELLFERNQEIVHSCDMVIAFWDGRERGGTWHTVKLAMTAEMSMWNGITRERIVGDGPPLSDLFATPEACIEGWERLEETVGHAEFTLTTVESNFECYGGVVFERHEHTGEPDPEAAVTARVSSAVLTFPWEAEQIAAELQDFGLEYEKYWIEWLKQDEKTKGTSRDSRDDLTFLSGAMAELAVSTLDVMEQETVQAWNDDPSEDTAEISVSSCYAWHRVGDRDWMESEGGPKLSKAADILLQEMKATPNSRLGSYGKRLFECQQGGMAQISDSDWSYIWGEYRKRKPKTTKSANPKSAIREWESKEEFDVTSVMASPPEPMAEEAVWMDVEDAVFVNLLAGSIDADVFRFWMATQPVQIRHLRNHARESAKFATIALQNRFSGDYGRVRDDYLMSFA